MSLKIHPTAMISEGATLGTDCEIGAGVIIGPHVSLGDRCVVQAHAVLEGHTTAGSDNFFGYGAIIGAPPQDYAYRDTFRTEVIIGANNIFREYVTIHRGTKDGTATVVGDNSMLMVGAHMGHNSHIGNKVIIANNCLLAGYVDVGDGCVLGGGSVYHQFLRVGRYAMVRGGTGFSKDIPPYLTTGVPNTVTGLNSIGLKRAGFSLEARKEIKAAYRAVFRSGRNVSDALAAARAERTWCPEAEFFFDFIAQSKRGICSASYGSSEEGSGES